MGKPEYIAIRRDYEKAIAATLETLSGIAENKIACIAVVALTSGGPGGHVAQFWNASTYDKLALAGVIQMEAITEEPDTDEDDEDAE